MKAETIMGDHKRLQEFIAVMAPIVEMLRVFAQQEETLLIGGPNQCLAGQNALAGRSAG